MRSFFNRFKSDPASRSSSSTSHHSPDDPSPSSHPPEVPAKAKSISRPTSIVRSLTPQQSPGLIPSQSSSSDTSSRPISHASRVSSDQCDGGAVLQTGHGELAEFGHGGLQASGTTKKVTFRSPIPTPTPSSLLDRHDDNSSSAGPSRALERPRPTSRGSAPILPRPSVAARKNSLPPLPPLSTIHDTPSSPSASSPAKSYAMSPTPSESSGMSHRSYLPPPNSWSEMAEEELIANLGPKERTRQEVLWEIVSSEERYVQELLKLNETFCKSLLPPSTTSPSLSLDDPIQTLSRTLSPSSSNMSPKPGSLHSRDDSFDFLPIAAKYSSHTPATSSSASGSTKSPPQDARPLPPLPIPAARLDAYQKLTNGRPGLPPPPPPAESSGMRKQSSFATLGSRIRGHHSLPPPARSASAQATTATPSFSASYARMSHQPSRIFRDPRSASSSTTSSVVRESVELPPELEKVLQVLAGGILEGHVKLAAALRKRYENQYPLVRSLADVFNAHSYILREYATYVLHLEKALEQVDESLSLALQPSSKRHSRQLGTTFEGRLGKLLLSLEELAVERGESGLVISLSKPFQRLLKYPLLFQNLLFNTDPSLREYEATLAMVDEVELIVRTIEDEKADWEEREKTRDVWARIEGLEKEKMLIAPKPNRLLIDETLLPSENSAAEGSQKQKKSFRRLSDILKGNESSDLYIVRFSDVSLLCERIGMTSLPTSSTLKRSPDSAPDLSSRAKRSSRRIASVRPRNLYRFVKIHEWHLRKKRESTEALVMMDEISKARLKEASDAEEEAAMLSTPRKRAPTEQPSTPSEDCPGTTPRQVPLKANDGPSLHRTIRPKAGTGADAETLASDRTSIMSFAFKGGDQVRPVRGVRPKSHQPAGSSSTSASAAGAAKGGVRPRQSGGPTAPTASSLQRRNSGGHMSGQAAAAKFAHRLRTAPLDGEGEVTIRAVSKSRRSLPPAMIMDGGSKALPTEVQVLGRRQGGGALSPTDRMNARIPKAPATVGKAGGLPKAPNGDEKWRGGVKGSPPASLSSRPSRPVGMAGQGTVGRSYGGKI